MMNPFLFGFYPVKVSSISQAYEFEHGRRSITQLLRMYGFAVKLVTASEVLDISEWRTPDAGFRKGDQSECIVRDRHTDVFDRADPDTRTLLTRAADGRN